MTFEELDLEWSKDSGLNIANIGNSALDISKLHHKYYTFYLREKTRYFRLEADYKKLRLDKYEFLTMGPTEETRNNGWRLPPQGKILKAEVQQYIEGDPDITKAMLSLNLQKEKLDYLESIIKMITFRNQSLKVALDWEKFKNGC